MAVEAIAGGHCYLLVLAQLIWDEDEAEAGGCRERAVQAGSGMGQG